MPIYEYKCSECGNVYEKRQKFSDPVDTVCNCEKKAPVTRITSAPALVFKGSGWYVNDYARGGSGGTKDKPDGDKGGGEKGGDKADTAAKPETTAKSKPSDTASSSSSDTSSKPAPAASKP